MIKITKEEIIKLAQAANLSLSQEEIPELVKRIESVLAYAEYLREFQDVSHALPQVSNVVREDSVKKVPVEPLLSLAPALEENYFVVPAILKQ